MSKEIRILIENYYDIQKVRVETFNRIVMFVKENFSNVQFEGQNNKIFKLLNEKKYAEFVKKYVLSHGKSETQISCASHLDFETHMNDASHSEFETQANNASYRKFETQCGDASHLKDETHEYNASHLTFETHVSGASQVLDETHMMSAIFEKLKEIENLVWLHNELYEIERGLYKRLDAWSKEHPLRKKYLNHVKGIGGVLASGLIAWLSEPMLKANYVSQVWSYCGLTPDSVRKKNEKLKYNPKLKTFCWKIGQSFIKFDCFGKKLYDDFKEQAKQKHPDWSKLHLHNYARRKVVKIFIASVWEVWRKMNKLQVTEPYPIQILNHKDLITTNRWIEKKCDV
jgi:hypothetical protein